MVFSLTSEQLLKDKLRILNILGVSAKIVSRWAVIKLHRDNLEVVRILSNNGSRVELDREEVEQSK